DSRQHGARRVRRDRSATPPRHYLGLGAGQPVDARCGFVDDRVRAHAGWGWDAASLPPFRSSLRRGRRVARPRMGPLSGPTRETRRWRRSWPRPVARRGDGVMAYDEELAERIRDLLAGEREVAERKMFGGLAFLIRGNLALAASGQGGALVRCNPEEAD